MKELVDHDQLYLFNRGKLFRSYTIFGAHPMEFQGKSGVYFAVWAPNAKQVNVIGDFNHWNGMDSPMLKQEKTGVWIYFSQTAREGDLYKFEVITQKGDILHKADPFAFFSELRPKTASVVYSLNRYHWQDQKWKEGRRKCTPLNRPMNIYEVHIGSWRKKSPEEYYTYRDLADLLVPYVKEMGYTHMEILPIMEHPYDGSWGYQITGYYSVTSRYGTPEDFQYLIDLCHQNNIGVILDWVPGHFCMDEHGLYEFDGGNIYGLIGHQHWGTMNFNFGKLEVQSFLISNAIFWFEKYHIDGLRIDSVSSMLYLDYGYENPNDAPKNKNGGNHNLEAIDFMRKLNTVVFQHYPDALMMAEESTAWPLVSAPVDIGGLGYNFKWDMGWMNDTLKYMEMDPLFRKGNHNLITFSMYYAFSENFVLALSHDEVVHGKRSLLDKMPGDYWAKFANYRILLCYQMFHPGKKLLFMGGEIAQFVEWRDYGELDWMLLDYEMHRNFQHFVKNINNLYKNEKSLWEIDSGWEGFEWIDADNRDQSIFIFMRKGKETHDYTLILLNCTPVGYKKFRLGVPHYGMYKLIFNSDEVMYGGKGNPVTHKTITSTKKWHNQPYSIEIKVPPLSGLVMKYDGKVLRVKNSKPKTH